MAQTKFHNMAERLFEELQERPLREWVTEQRDAGLTWRRIEKELFSMTNGLIDVSHPTLIAWYGEQPAA